MSEFDEKQQRLRSLLGERGLDAIVLQRVSSFAWATGGAASYVNTATTDGGSSLLITPAGRFVVANNIEATRLEQEEKLGEQGWTFKIAPWYEANSAIAELARGLRLGADTAFPGATNLSNEMARLRTNLTVEEGARARRLARACAEAMDRAIRAVRPGQTEYEIAGLLAHEAQSRGAQAIVNLIATDERVSKFRHPLPTDKRLDRYAMLVLCGRRWGQVCSITRLVHFGPLPEEMRRKAQACARVDATLIAATRPGQKLSEVFQRAQKAYADGGYADEWQRHHQGGPAGYEPREYLAMPDSADLVAAGQTYAWNPSITGTKSEDTILVGPTENEVLTTIPGWPTLPIQLADGQTMARPAILELI